MPQVITKGSCFVEAISVVDFLAIVEREYLKRFPKAWIDARAQKILGFSIGIRFGIQPRGQWANKIVENDPAYTQLSVRGLTSAIPDEPGPKLLKIQPGDPNSLAFKDIIDVDQLQGNLRVKAEPGSHYAFNTVKVGWRKKKGTPEQVLKHIVNYFSKLRVAVDSNKDRLPDNVS